MPSLWDLIFLFEFYFDQPKCLHNWQVMREVSDKHRQKVAEDRCKDILSSMGLLHRIYDRSCSGRAFQINRIVSLFGTSSIAWPFGQLSPRISDSSVFLVWSFSASVNLDLMIKPVSKNVFFRFWRWDIYAPRIAVVPSWKLVSSLPSLMEVLSIQFSKPRDHLKWLNLNLYWLKVSPSVHLSPLSFDVSESSGMWAINPILWMSFRLAWRSVLHR
jgi:hypothetical protein